MWRVVVALMVLVSVARADDFGGWTYKAPAGYKREEFADHVAYTKVTGKTFCQFTIFAAHSRGVNDAATQWENVVVKTFQSIEGTKPVKAKTKNLSYVSIDADAELNGRKVALTQYILLADNGVASLVVVANGDAVLAKCPTKPIVESITLADAPAAAAPAEPIDGVWSMTHDNSDGNYARAQYTFNADGTYRMHAEVRMFPTTYFVSDESGAWAQSGLQVVLTPNKSVTIQHDGDKQQNVKRRLAVQTLSAKKVRAEDGKAWNLVIEKLGTYSDSYKPVWKYPPN